VVAVSVVTLVALAAIYVAFGKPVQLRQTEHGIERICGNKQQTIRYDELAGFRAKWTDILRNGVYSHTQVRLAFSPQDPEEPVLSYDFTADYDTLKYNQLQEFQREIAEIVAERMAKTLASQGNVKWTDKLTLHSNCLEMRKKPSAAPEVVGFDRITRWTIGEGLFKLGIDGTSRPTLLESTSQWNFYPGLLVFTQLCGAPNDDETADEEEPALIG